MCKLYEVVDESDSTPSIISHFIAGSLFLVVVVVVAVMVVADILC